MWIDVVIGTAASLFVVWVVVHRVQQRKRRKGCAGCSHSAFCGSCTACKTKQDENGGEKNINSMVK